MDCDMVVALSQATVDGSTILGHNCNRPGDEGLSLIRRPGRQYALGERLLIDTLVVPQARRTHTVLACTSTGRWGYWQGINDQGVAIGLTGIRTRLRDERMGLQGTDLVRLGLERAGSAMQAVDVLTDFVARMGQSRSAGDDLDSAFLIADAREAYHIELCGRHWALQQVRQVRAVTSRCDLRQDWDRISRGLADLAIVREWWPGNGSKLDFAGALAVEDAQSQAALRRWGRATLLLEQNNGHLDVSQVRHLLGDHVAPEGNLPAELPAAAVSLCRHALTPPEVCTSASMVVHLPAAGQELPVAWWAFGPPCSGVYFPLLLVGELPWEMVNEGDHLLPGCLLWRRLIHWSRQMAREPIQAAAVRDALAHLQERFDQDTRDFQAEAALLGHPDEHDPHREVAVHRLAESFMQHHLEYFDTIWSEVARPGQEPATEHEVLAGMYVG
jgi:secernin